MGKALTNDVEITLGDETYQMRPTMKAASAISRQYGGFLGAMQAVATMNLEAMQYIVRQGLTMKETRISTDDLNEAVWSAGAKNIADPIMKFVRVLQNGGRDPDLEDDGDSRDDKSDDEGNGDI